MTSLYRHFDADGRLLYVGISATPTKRTYDHSLSADWFGSIARIAIEHHSTRESALAAERAAIMTEGPAYNKKHNIRQAETLTRAQALKEPKPKVPKMDSFLKFRVSPEEKAVFMAAAKAEGVTLSDVIREGFAEFMNETA